MMSDDPRTKPVLSEREWIEELRIAASDPPVDAWLLYSIQVRLRDLDEAEAEPPPSKINTKEENIAFRKAWDQRVLEGWERDSP